MLIKIDNETYVKPETVKAVYVDYSGIICVDTLDGATYTSKPISDPIDRINCIEEIVHSINIR